MPNSLHFSYLSAMLAATAAGCPATVAAGELSVHADTPAVTVSTRPARRNFMQLPALEFRFRIEAACDAGESADRFSLSIADTRISLPKERLRERWNEVTVTIPAGQIPPVRIEGFCIAEAGGTPGDEPVRIPSVLSAQSSLLCVSDTGSDMTYASTSLDVLVHCQSPEVQESP
jgi:hypothetical protein